MRFCSAAFPNIMEWTLNHGMANSDAASAAAVPTHYCAFLDRQTYRGGSFFNRGWLVSWAVSWLNASCLPSCP